ncbi:hypothetical protein C8J57DRAFT_1539238 [Mycena rebaudengoi]|nr:hypothetical protein C8J57DRAFT_1539238 [Mycena rebaudengoi]
MQILKGEQLRIDSGGEEQATQLETKFIRYAYNQAPFDRQSWDADTKPLAYWKRQANHSNAKQIGRTAVKIFSIVPSEIYVQHRGSRIFRTLDFTLSISSIQLDAEVKTPYSLRGSGDTQERCSPSRSRNSSSEDCSPPASLSSLGYNFNAARFETIQNNASDSDSGNATECMVFTPENLITSARLYELYTKGITEGDYIHEAFVALDEALVPAGTPQIRSAPSLIDLIHKENISPPMVDEEALEELLFNYPDPFDLAETEHVNFNDPDVPAVARSRDVFAIAEYIKLDSPALEELIHPSKQSGPHKPKAQ